MNKSSRFKRAGLFGILVFVITAAGLWQFLPGSPGQDSLILSTDQRDTPASPSLSQNTLPPGSVRASIVGESTQEKLPAISPEMAAEIRHLSRHSAEDLAQTTNPDGSVSMEMQDRFQSVLVGVRDSNGNIVMRHSEEFLQNVSAP